MPDATLSDNGSIDIERLGAQGDGVASGPDGPMFIPFTLPGETWSLKDGAYQRLSDAPDRVTAPCRHFGTCGGCVAQHMSDTLYADWKAGLVRQALAYHDIEIELQPLWRASPGSRRRLVLSVNVAGDRAQLGFRAARSHEFIEVSECTIAAPHIVEVFPVLRSVLDVVAAQGGLGDDVRVHVLQADNGIDVLVDGSKGELSAAVREKLAGVAHKGGLLRLRVGRDEIFQTGQPMLQVGGGLIQVPAGVFVQAVGAAEAVMAQLAIKALGRAKHVADLFCGLGTFALPIAKRARVLAVDNQPEAVAALGNAVRHVQGLKPIESLRRDLFREPLSRNELNAFDAVVFDPPRAGAAAQSESLAKSKVPCIVAVSCNPVTFARDLRTLIDGGYKLQSVTPLDQFLYSAHVEAVAVLRR